jgi:hypothetical protein
VYVHIPPSPARFTAPLAFGSVSTLLGSASRVVSSRKAITVPRAALPMGRCYLLIAQDSYPCRQALSRLSRSYRLMRQT